jgi:hypothetical protein
MKRDFIIYPIILLLSGFNSIANSQESCTTLIHVAKTGSDQPACGASGSPCLTINYAIQRALLQGFHHVRVGIGTYNEVVVLKNGINLWGGFSVSWTQTSRSTISGGLYLPDIEYIGVEANNITGLTVLSDFNISSPDAQTAGKSTYGLHTVGSAGLQLQNCIVTAGSGANGTNGLNGIDASSVSAPAGSPGQNGEIFTGLCNDIRKDGGAGATNPLTVGGSSGGAGGQGGSADTKCQSFPLVSDYTARPGLNGSSASYYEINGVGYRGLGGGLCSPGNTGGSGKTLNGAGGAGASISGLLNGNYWRSTEGQPGTLGEHGTGGGGGGGSGGCDTGDDNTGSGGGGGGAGGARAPEPGTGGQSGGSSFGIFLLNSSIKLIDCNISGGTGGTGGKGGNGGLGQPGGQGGPGGLNVYGGGEGGKGGNGGVSGAGGGGAGGSSYGIYGVNSTTSKKNAVIAQGLSGSGGDGGLVNYANGLAGQNGIASSNGGTVSILDDNSLLVKNDSCFLTMINESLIAESKVKIYPNPFSEYTTIEFPNEANESYDLHITDISGNLVRIINRITNAKIIFYRREMKTGYYYIEIRGPRIYRGVLILI